MTAIDAGRLARVLCARLLRAIGWAGVAGSAALVAALGWVAPSWRVTDAADVPPPVVATSRDASVAAPGPAPNPAPVLATAADIPALLLQIEHAAAGQGLDWRAADYRLVAATPLQPAGLEVRFGMKAPYPRLRAMLSQLQSGIPGLAIREFSLVRPDAEAAEVDARFGLVIFLQDGAIASDASPAATAPSVPSAGSLP